ncbi:hypothetical protein LTR53_012990, partial [Teratosphaeriaceae sp. CCFEE 6253]
MPMYSELADNYIDIWEHAALLYHGYEWQSAMDAFRDLANSLEGEPSVQCALNVAMIQARLGDLTEGRQTLKAVAEYYNSYALTYCLLGLVEWELGDPHKAVVCFDDCLERLRNDGRTSYTPKGLEFTLEASHVHLLLQNLRETGFDHYGAVKHGTCTVPAVTPAECIFEAPPRGRSANGDGGDNRYSALRMRLHDGRMPSDKSVITAGEESYWPPPLSVRKRDSGLPKLADLEHGGPNHITPTTIPSTMDSEARTMPTQQHLQQNVGKPAAQRISAARMRTVADITSSSAIGSTAEATQGTWLPRSDSLQWQTSGGGPPSSSASPQHSSGSSKGVLGHRTSTRTADSWVDKAARKIAEPKAPKPAEVQDQPQLPRRIRIKPSFRALFKRHRAHASLPTAPETLLPRIQGTPEYKAKHVPRDARGEYGNVTELVLFVHEHDIKAPLDQQIWPPGPRQ